MDFNCAQMNDSIRVSHKGRSPRIESERLRNYSRYFLDYRHVGKYRWKYQTPKFWCTLCRILKNSIFSTSKLFTKHQSRIRCTVMSSYYSMQMSKRPNWIWCNFNQPKVHASKTLSKFGTKCPWGNLIDHSAQFTYSNIGCTSSGPACRWPKQ